MTRPKIPTGWNEGWRRETIAIKCRRSLHDDTPVQNLIDAEVRGPWAVHGASEYGAAELSRTRFVLTHRATGLAVGTWYWTPDHAKLAAAFIDELEPKVGSATTVDEANAAGNPHLAAIRSIREGGTPDPSFHVRWTKDGVPRVFA